MGRAAICPSMKLETTAKERSFSFPTPKLDKYVACYYNRKVNKRNTPAKQKEKKGIPQILKYKHMRLFLTCRFCTGVYSRPAFT